MKWDETLLNSMLTIIIDPRATCGGADIAGRLAMQASELVEFVTASPSRPSEAEETVVIPGDLERATLADRSRSGIQLSPGTWSEILAAADSLGVDETSAREIMGTWGSVDQSFFKN